MGIPLPAISSRRDHQPLCLTMVLSRPDIIKAIKSGAVVFSRPVAAKAVRQVSIDLRLGRSFSTFKKQEHVAAIRLTSKAIFDADLWEQIEADSYIVEPQGFVLAETLEHVTVGNKLMGLVEAAAPSAPLPRAACRTHRHSAPAPRRTFAADTRKHGPECRARRRRARAGSSGCSAPVPARQAGRRRRCVAPRRYR
jgi:hypothetical protein